MPICSLPSGLGRGWTIRSAPRAFGLVTNPAMSGRRHLSRVSTPSWSNVAPPATIAKSSRHDSTMRACTLLSAASRLSTTIFRPLIPPRALHHWLNTSAVSKNSWFKPGRPTNPVSENVATWIESGVTPVVGAPDGAPFWHTSLRVPKSADPAVAPDVDPFAVDDDEVAAPPPFGASLRPQAAATTAPHTSTTTS